MVGFVPPSAMSFSFESTSGAKSFVDVKRKAATLLDSFLPIHQPG